MWCGLLSPHTFSKVGILLSNVHLFLAFGWNYIAPATIASRCSNQNLPFPLKWCKSLIPIALLTDSLKANLRRTFKPFLVLSLLEFRWICNQTKSSQQFSVICTCTAQSLARNVTFVAVFLSRTFPGNIVEIFFHFEHYLTPLWNRKTSIMSTRKASHAGSWYTSDGGRTCSQILLFWKMNVLA